MYVTMIDIYIRFGIAILAIIVLIATIISNHNNKKKEREWRESVSK